MEPELPLVRAFLDGSGDLESAARELLARWVQEGSGWYFRHGDEPPEERTRAEALEQRFLVITAEYVAVRSVPPGESPSKG